MSGWQNIYQVVNYKKDKKLSNYQQNKLGFIPFKKNHEKTKLLEQLKQKQLEETK